METSTRVTRSVERQIREPTTKVTSVFDHHNTESGYKQQRLAPFNTVAL